MYQNIFICLPLRATYSGMHDRLPSEKSNMYFDSWSTKVERIKIKSRYLSHFCCSVPVYSTKMSWGSWPVYLNHIQGLVFSGSHNNSTYYRTLSPLSLGPVRLPHFNSAAFRNQRWSMIALTAR